MPQKQQLYINKFKRMHYDQIALLVPRGRREDIREFASKQNTSMNGLMNMLLQSAMNMTDTEWHDLTNEEGSVQS